MMSLPDKVRWLEQVLADAELSETAKLAATRIMLHHNSETGRCDPSYQRIAAGICLGRRATINAVGELRRRGWIQVQNRTTEGPGRSSSFKSNQFVLRCRAEREWKGDGLGQTSPLVHGHAPPLVHGGAPPPGCPGAEPRTTLVQDGAPPLVHGGAPKHMNLEHEKENTGESHTPSLSRSDTIGLGNGVKADSKPSADSVGAAFEAFWQQYPQKEGKDGAERVFRRLVRDSKATPAELIQGAMRAAALADRVDAARWIPLAKNWLTDGRWKDPPRAPASAPERSGRTPQRQPSAAAFALMAGLPPKGGAA